MRGYLLCSTAVALAMTGGTALAPTGAVAAAGKGDALVAGVLAARDGKPLAGQAIKVYALPGEKQLRKLETGQSVKWTLIGAGKTAKNGQFTVKRNAKKIPAKTKVFDATVVASNKQGVVSVFDTSFETVGSAKKIRVVSDLVDAGDDQVVQVGEATAAGASPGGLVPTTDLVSRAEAKMPVRSTGAFAATKSGVPFLRLQAHPGAAAAAQAARVGKATKAKDPYTCNGGSTKLLKKHENRDTIVSSLHAKVGGHKSTFELSKGSDASLGTATKMGKVWSVGGGASRSLNSSTTWGTKKGPGNWNLKTRYTMGEYQNSLGEYGVCTRWKSLRPISHEGGAQSSKGTALKATKCRGYEKGAIVRLTDTRATRYEGGLSVAKVIGFDLSSTAGFSKSEQVVVKITKKKRKICGTNKYPGQHPKRLVVKKAKK